jgi:hypothetical protein
MLRSALTDPRVSSAERLSPVALAIAFIAIISARSSDDNPIFDIVVRE